MVIDFDVKCEDLGITWEAYSSASDKVDRLIGKLYFEDGADPDDVEAYKAMLSTLDSVLTHEELVAYIRWYNLHRRYPDLFTWDGAISDAGGA